jgi:hypothetical protein
MIGERNMKTLITFILSTLGIFIFLQLFTPKVEPAYDFIISLVCGVIVISTVKFKDNG